MRDFDRTLPGFLVDVLSRPTEIQKTAYQPIFTLPQLAEIIRLASDVLLKMPNYIVLGDKFSDIAFVGDTHGDIVTTSRILKGFLERKVDNIVFLGDYVDRGTRSLMNLVLVTSMAMAWPEHIVILRGNHEDWEVNAGFGFQGELAHTYPSDEDFDRVHALVDRLYDMLSIAVLSPRGSIGFHAGIPKGMNSIFELNKIPKPHANLAMIESATDLKKLYSFFMQVRWNDPREEQQWDFIPSFRGPDIWTFDARAVDPFLLSSGAQRIIRAHESSRGAFQKMFGGKLLHVFSAEPYFNQILAGRVIHERRDGKTILCDLDLEPVQEII